MTISHRMPAALRSTFFVAALAACCAVSHIDHAVADDETSFIGVVSADKVFVRSGPADSYYPIGHVNVGDLVKVVGERFGWARIHAVGPTFEDDAFFGYIIYPKTQPGRFRLEEDGTTGRTLGRTDVLAPNLNTDFNPNDSWKPLIRLNADQSVRVLETTESANNIVQKVALPNDAEVWVSMRYIDRAGDERRAAWQRHMDPDAAAEPAQPATSEAEQAKPEEHEADQRAEVESRDEPEVHEDREPATHPEALGRDEQPAPEVEPLEEAEDRESRDDVAEAQQEARQEQPQETDAAGDEARESIDTEDDVDEDETDASEAQPEAAGEDEAEPDSTTAERLSAATLEDLEEAFAQLRNEPIETAEVTPLRRMYLELAERADGERDQRFAEQRAEQLALWREIQQNRQRLARLQSRAELTGERMRAARRAVDDAGDYTAVGRLSVSMIYDGQRLPRLLRLQEPGTGRTVAYVQPEIEYDLTGMIGQLIGVIGDKEYDGGLRLNLIRPRRVDILAPQE